MTLLDTSPTLKRPAVEPTPKPADYRQRIYDRYAAEFKDETEQFNERFAAYMARIYAYHLRGWLPRDRNARIVDLACGCGRMLYMLQEAGYANLMGVDISPDQLALARQVIDNVVRADVLQFVQASAGEYDLITGIDIIEHFRKDEVLTFLDGCWQALRPGGRLILQTPNADSPWVSPIRYGDFTHEVCFASDGLRRLLTLSGFADVEAREYCPAPVDKRGIVRHVLWRGLRLGMRLWNLIELGNPGSGVCSRIFLISAVKPKTHDRSNKPQ